MQPELALLMSSVIAWIVVSLPIYVASKLLSRKSSFIRAMVASLGSSLLFSLVFLIVLHLGPSVITAPLGLLLGFLAGLLVFKEVFEVGWFRAFMITVLAYLVFMVIAALISLILTPFIPTGPVIRWF